MSLNRAFGERFRVARQAAGVSTRQLGARMQELGFAWHQSTVIRTESAERPVRLDEAVALAALLNINLEAVRQPTSEVIAAAHQEWVDAESLRRVTEALERAEAAERRVHQLESAVARAQRALRPVSLPPEVAS